MKRFVLAPDSFKGTLSSQEVCEIMEAAILRHIPDATVVKTPIADGGEGLVEAYLAVFGGERVKVEVHGPRTDIEQRVQATYGILPNGVAVMEMAEAAGLPLAWGNAPVSERNPMHTTTFGVGELLLHAQARGCREVILGIGGSATNDGGIGMATALGYRLLDEEGRPVPPTGAGLARISRIERPEKALGLRVCASCDVDNPLTGPKGAAAVFGPQKGAVPEQVVQLDGGLSNLARCMARDLGKDVQTLPGAGAAGGLGAGVVAFLDGALQPGIDMMLDAVGFDALLREADMVFTGEGKIDGQSIHGKVPVGVSRRAKAAGVPCLALCGCIGEGVEEVYDSGLTAVFSALRDSAPDFETIKRESRRNIEQLADAVVRLLTAMSGKG